MATFLILAILMLCGALAIRTIRKNHKEGTACGCGCSGCSSSCTHHNEAS